MEIRNSFDVPLPPAEAWAVLMNVPRIAPCMPGAELLETIDERTFKGKVSVKLGPVALGFTGTAAFEEIDDTAKQAKLKASGADSKGRGRADASVRFGLEPIEGGSRVNVVTDVVLSGAVAQYGRGAGLIHTVAGQLVGQFADCLCTMLQNERTETALPEPVVAAATSTASPTPQRPAPQRPVPVTKPISGFSLMFGAIWAMIAGLFRDKR